MCECCYFYSWVIYCKLVIRCDCRVFLTVSGVKKKYVLSQLVLYLNTTVALWSSLSRETKGFWYSRQNFLHYFSVFGGEIWDTKYFTMEEIRRKVESWNWKEDCFFSHLPVLSFFLFPSLALPEVSSVLLLPSAVHRKSSNFRKGSCWFW